MTTHGLLIAGLISLSIVGCASDPNKEAQDARDAQLSSERKQSQSNADDRSDTRVKAAEMQRENTDATATGSSATKDRTSADAKLTEARAIHRAKANERLEKADARMNELKALADKGGGKTSTAARDALKTVDTQRTTVTRELEQLPRVGDENWDQAKKSVDSQLQTLEDLIKKSANEVDKTKK